MTTVSPSDDEEPNDGQDDTSDQKQHETPDETTQESTSGPKIDDTESEVPTEESPPSTDTDDPERDAQQEEKDVTDIDTTETVDSITDKSDEDAESELSESVQSLSLDDQPWSVRNAELRNGDVLAWPVDYDERWTHAVDTDALPDVNWTFTGVNTQPKNPQITLDYKFEENGIIWKMSTGSAEKYLDIHWLIDRLVQVPVLAQNPRAFPTDTENVQDSFDRLMQDGEETCRFEYVDDLSVADDNYVVRIPAELRKLVDADAGTVYIKPGTRYVAMTNSTMYVRNATWLVPLTAYQKKSIDGFYI